MAVCGSPVCKIAFPHAVMIHQPAEDFMDYKDNVVRVDFAEVTAARRAEFYITGVVAIASLCFIAGLAIANLWAVYHG